MKKIVLIALAACLFVGCGTLMMKFIEADIRSSSGGRSNNTTPEPVPFWIGDFQCVYFYRGENEEVSIRGYRGSSKDVIIPESIRTVRDGGKITLDIPVTVISNNAFNRKQLTSVTIPEGVITIGMSAFANNNLTSVTIPDSVTSIGNYAFANNNLTSVTIPSNVTSIGDQAFLGNKLTSVNIPSSVTTIGNRVFFSNQLTNVDIPSGVTSIGYDAFADNKLTSLTIPEGVTTIGTRAFWGNQITNVTFPEGVTSIGDYAFENKDNIFLNGILIIYGLRAGTYELKNERWYYNGTALETPARLVCREGIYVAKIDGKSAGNLSAVRINNNVVRPAGSANQNIWVLPGFHRIEVGYYLESYTSTMSSRTWTEGTVTFEYALVLESGIYDITGTEQEEQILFQIRKR